MVLTMPRATSRKKRRIFQGKRQCNLSQFGYKKSSHCDAGRNKTDNNLYQFIFTPWPPPPWSPSSIVILSPGTSLKCWMCLNTLALIVFAFSSGADTADSVTLVTAPDKHAGPRSDGHQQLETGWRLDSNEWQHSTYTLDSGQHRIDFKMSQK